MFLPAGSQDQIGHLLDRKAKVYQLFRKVAKKRAYKPIETPVVEYAETFTNKHVGMEFHTLLKWFDRDGEIEVLRPDWTTAIARALVNQDPKQLKWFYQGSVYRQDKDGIESNQAGIEIIRSEPLFGEIESLFFAVEFLKQTQIDEYLIELGHTGIYEAIIAPLQLSHQAESKLRQAMHDKQTDVVQRLTASNPDVSEQLHALIHAYGDKEVLVAFKEKYQSHLELTAIIEHLLQLINVLNQLGINDVIVDLGRVKELPYYSGTMFRGYIKDSGQSCFSGGRYDSLYHQFDQKISAVGLAFDVDILAEHIKDETQPRRVCLLASEATHVVAELKSQSYQDEIVDIVYQQDLTIAYDEVIDLRNEGSD